mgnify:CR=1 FL=1
MTRLSDLLLRATARRVGPWGDLTGDRAGVMLHYTAGTDLSGLQWLLFDPACRVSYNWLVLDDGTVVSVAPKGSRAWHAGACRRSNRVVAYGDANSAFYGIAIAAAPGDHATERQLAMVVQLVAALFAEHGWSSEWVESRLTDHAAEAWPRGRKVDTGDVLPLDLVQSMVAARLRAQAAA